MGRSYAGLARTRILGLLATVKEKNSDGEEWAQGEPCLLPTHNTLVARDQGDSMAHGALIALLSHVFPAA